MSSNDNFIQPMILRQTKLPLLEKDGPPCAVYHCSKSGETNEDLFMIWLRQCAGHARSSTEYLVFSILDSYSSPCTLEAYMSRKYNVIVAFSTQPHT